MSDKFKALLFLVLVISSPFVGLYLPEFYFRSSIFMIIITIAFWNTPGTVYPRLSGLVPNSFTLRNLAMGAGIGALFFVPYFVMISVSDYSFSLTVSFWDNLFYLINQSMLEEFIFRGVLFFVIVRYAGEWKTAIGLGVLFAAMHLGNPNSTLLASANTLLASVLLSAMAFQTKSLFMPIGFHVLWNVVQGPILDLPVSGNRLSGLLNHNYVPDNVFLGYSYGPEGGLYCTIYLCVAIFVVIRYARAHPNNISQWFHYTYGKGLPNVCFAMYFLQK